MYDGCRLLCCEYGVWGVCVILNKRKICRCQSYTKQKNGGYYQLGHRGRLSNSEGFRKKLIQELAPALGEEFATRIADIVMDDMKKQLSKENPNE